MCEPGSTGTDWCMHYSFDLFSLRCDEFHFIGPQVGETLLRFEVLPRDLMLGERACGKLRGFRHVARHGGHFLSCLKNKAFPLRGTDGGEASLAALTEPLAVGEPGDWPPRRTSRCGSARCA